MILSDEQIAGLARGPWSRLSDSEILHAVQVCQTYRLNPLRNEIYVIKDNRGNLRFQTSIDGFRKVAEDTGNYLGQTGAEWCGADGVWRDVWLEKGPPAAVKIGVYKKGLAEPTWVTLTWAEYSPNAGRIAKNMPAHMLAKAAESLALRKAFPGELGGIYSFEELDNEGKGPVNEDLAGYLVEIAVASGGESSKIALYLRGKTSADEESLLISFAERAGVSKEEAKEILNGSENILEAAKEVLDKVTKTVGKGKK